MAKLPPKYYGRHKSTLHNDEGTITLSYPAVKMYGDFHDKHMVHFKSVNTTEC